LSNAEKYYTLLNVATDHDTFIGTFTSGGYYAVEPLGSDLLVIGLNTIEMSPLVQTPAGTESDQDAVKAELDWLDAKLAAAQSAGQKVWLLMHAPVGADEGTTAGSVNASGQLTSATMMWEANYQSWFMTILSKYPGVIAMTLAGHTHMDEFRIMSPGHALEITPGISPVFGNNPAYKIFTVGHDALKPLDYRCVNYNLSSPTAEFRSYYTYSEAYYAHGYLDESLARLFPRLKSSSTQRALYKEHFYSGNDTDNLITDTNWPVYWSGIGMMEAQDLINAVNSY
jgi:hypothetical protein